jgi:hypothetical protein
VYNLTKTTWSVFFNINKEPTSLKSNYESELPLKPQVWLGAIEIYTSATELCIRTLQYIALVLLVCTDKVLGSSPFPDSDSPAKCYP